MTQMHTILYTTDFSDSSKSALPLAYSLARDHGARLIVLHVLPAGTYELVNLAQLGQGESAQQFEDSIRHDLRRIQPPDDRVAMEYKLAKGDPAASIIKVAEKTACDLIVLGTHGRTGLRRMLMGCVAEHVMRSAPCPVLVVKGEQIPPTRTGVDNNGYPARRAGPGTRASPAGCKAPRRRDDDLGQD